MADCVISPTIGDDGPALACVVHTHFAPCPDKGRPASSTSIHGDIANGREQILAYWRSVTGGQRRLVLHNGNFADGTHDTGPDGTGCQCRPEVVEPVELRGGRRV